MSYTLKDIQVIKAELCPAYVLEQFGHLPERADGERLWYCSPFRPDSDPSFTVWKHEGKWCCGDWAEEGVMDVFDLLHRLDDTATTFDIQVGASQDFLYEQRRSGWRPPVLEESSGSAVEIQREHIEETIREPDASVMNHFLFNRTDSLENIPASWLNTRWRVGATSAGLVVPYYRRNGEMTFPKYRPIGEKMLATKGGTYGDVLYGEWLDTDPSKPVLLCEGETDCWAADYAVGDRYAVLGIPTGVGSRPKQAESLAGREVWIAFDGDEAGRKGAAKWGVALQAVGCAVFYVDLPDGRDAASVADLPHLLRTDYLDTAPVAPEEPSQLAKSFVDWETFWSTDFMDSNWLFEPVVAAGRGHAMWAPGKTGKSYFALMVAACLSTGTTFGSFPGHPDKKPTRVLYIDYENTHADLQDRLRAFGFEGEQFENLFYAVFPEIPPLDVKKGGEALLEEALRVGAELVIIDTTIRAISGEENSNDTFKDLYNYTGIRLKHHGIAYLRLDHAGKDIEKGARGASAKNDDVDIVWKLTAADDKLMTLKATHRRMSWVPETFQFRILPLADLPDGGQAISELLDKLGVLPGASQRQAEEAVRDSGHSVPRTLLRAVVDYRKAPVADTPSINWGMLQALAAQFPNRKGAGEDES